MTKTLNEYKKLDYSKLNFADEPTPIEESLKKYPPMYIPQEVLDGTKEIRIKMEGIQYV